MEESPAPLPENDIQLIASDDDLGEALRALRKMPELGVDLEFDQNRYTYGFNLCLIQISDGRTCYLIDPFAIQDLAPLWAIMEDPAITKIFHHATNDLLLLSKLGCRPRQIFDTDVAAKILNYEKSSLANVLAEELGIGVNKAMQSSNWNLRPLTQEQLRYAAQDVRYLCPLKERLVAKIEELGRLHWLEEEGHLLERIAYVVQEHPHLRLKGISRFSPFQLYILQALYAFRESLAEQLNKPAAQVMGNEALLDLALHPRTDVYEWVHHTKGIHRRLKSERHTAALHKVLRQARQQAESNNLPQENPENRYRRPAETAETVRREEQIRRLQEELVRHYGLHTSRMLLNQSHIQHYAQHNELIRTRQYARDVINEVAAELGLELKAQPASG